MGTILVHTFMILAAAAVVGCGQAPERPEKKSEKQSSEQPDETLPVDEAGGIELAALEFGAYLAEPPEDLATKQVSVEFGYLDVREQKDGDKEDIFDYRFKQAAVFVQDGHLPEAAAEGCLTVKTISAAKNTAKKAVFSGGAAGEQSFVGGFARIAGKDDETSVSTLERLKVRIQGLTDEVVEVESPVVPTAAAIQLAGAIDANVTVNTFVRDINKTLGDSQADLLIGDVGTAKNYNLVVVTFYPSAGAAEPTPVRCYLPAGGAATLARDRYQKMLPFRAVIGHFANVSVTTTNGVTVWSAAIAGQGAEDLTVK